MITYHRAPRHHSHRVCLSACVTTDSEHDIRTTIGVVAIVASTVAAVGLIARYVPITNHVALVVAVASPYLLLAAPISIALFLVGRRWTPATLATVLTAVAVAVHLPMYVADKPAADDVPLRVMTANVYLGLADAGAVVATAVAHADVLAVEELTNEEVSRFAAAGLDKAFPYRALDARDYASGGGVWSRYPITNQSRISDYKLAMVRAQIRVPGVANDPTILVAHMSGPWPQPIDEWVADLEHMKSTMDTLSRSAGDGCAIVAGDFNSTMDMAPFRRLLDGGYRDAAEQAGAGFTLTYPANMRIPPFMGIDHVVTNRCTATSADTVALPGSDHRGLVATVALPT